MVAAFVLISGIMLVVVVGAAVLIYLGTARVLPSLMPLVPWTVMVGTILLMLADVLLLFGDKQDRKIFKQDMQYLIPTLLVSIVLWKVSQFFLWRPH